MSTPRHQFFESDNEVTISVFDRGAKAEDVSVQFEPRKLSYTHGDQSLILEPLRGQIDPAASSFRVLSVKVEIKLKKMSFGRWGELIGDSPDLLASTSTAPPPNPTARPRTTKNWDGITEDILSSQKDKTTDEDPNVGGEAVLNGFFQKLFSDADEDTKRAMMKSYQESGGTTLSTNWDEVKKAPVEVKPPSGSEWKQWA
ncbi:hypothetical protein HGRIS_007945 [Hohenbuehelia grisea]|uniref:SGS-domain-containing protein n=1 Tax=Hohenbuehelia grisea TaxID=104357 RepID=A0ABR3J6F0_9AGAR